MKIEDLFKKYPKSKKVYKYLCTHADVQGLVVVNPKETKKAVHVSKHAVNKSVKLLYHHHFLNAVDVSNHAYTIPKITKRFIKDFHHVKHANDLITHYQKLCKQFASVAKRSHKALNRSSNDIKVLLRNKEQKKHKLDTNHAAKQSKANVKKPVKHQNKKPVKASQMFSL